MFELIMSFLALDMFVMFGSLVVLVAASRGSAKVKFPRLRRRSAIALTASFTIFVLGAIAVRPATEAAEKEQLAKQEAEIAAKKQADVQAEAERKRVAAAEVAAKEKKAADEMAALAKRNPGLAASLARESARVKRLEAEIELKYSKLRDNQALTLPNNIASFTEKGLGEGLVAIEEKDEETFNDLMNSGIIVPLYPNQVVTISEPGFMTVGFRYKGKSETLYAAVEAFRRPRR